MGGWGEEKSNVIPDADINKELSLPDPGNYWENRARAAEEALRSLKMCFVILCDREENNTVIITDKELIEVDPNSILATFHDKEKAEMRIHHVKR